MDLSEAEGWMRWFLDHPPERLLIPILLARSICGDGVTVETMDKLAPGILNQWTFQWPSEKGESVKADAKEERKRHLAATAGHGILN